MTDPPEPAPRDQVSYRRLLWVAPLTLAAALAVCVAIRFVVQALSPTVARMPQLGTPMVILVVEGVVAAIVVFALMGLFVPRPIHWFRIVAVAALLLSLLPDIGLLLGGQSMLTAMRVVGPLATIGGPSGPPPGAGGGPSGPSPGAGGGPGGPGGLTGMPGEQVLVLILLHVAVAAVCIVLLTTLARKPAASWSAPQTQTQGQGQGQAQA